jgi:hypothetical protein
MKSSETKPVSSHLSHTQKASQPFFQKDGEGLFFPKETPRQDFFFNTPLLQTKPLPAQPHGIIRRQETSEAETPAEAPPEPSPWARRMRRRYAENAIGILNTATEQTSDQGIPVFGATAAQLDAINATLALLPSSNYNAIPRIVVATSLTGWKTTGGASITEDSIANRLSGPVYQRLESELGWTQRPRLELSNDSFRQAMRRAANRARRETRAGRMPQASNIWDTLIHETGHFTATAFDLDEFIRLENFPNTCYGGTNSSSECGGAWERYADAYMNHFTSPHAERETEGAAVTGALSSIEAQSGGEAVQPKLINDSRPVSKSPLQIQTRRRRTPSVSQTAAADVRESLSETPPDFTTPFHTPMRHGGAFATLNGLSPANLIDTLRGLNTAERNLLLSNVQLSFDIPRLRLAISASLASDRDNAVKAVTILDETRAAGTGSFSNVFTQLQGLSAARIRTVLGLLDLETVQLIRSHLGDAPAASREALTGAANTVIHNTFAQRVQEALALSPPDFQSDPGRALPVPVRGPNGGVFFILNGLNPTDLIGTLKTLTSAQRTQIFNNLDLTNGLYDRPRLELAVKAAMTESVLTGVNAITLLDAIRTAGTGSFSPVFALIQTMPRANLLDMLVLFDQANLQLMQGRIATDAPAAIQQRLTEVFADVMATPAMTATDLIDLASVAGAQDRRMARMYNRYGQLIHSHAQANTFATDILAGVMSVEAGGRTFDAGTDRAIIRFENHVFWNRWGNVNAANRAVFNQHFTFDRAGRPQDGHQFRVNATDAWQTFHGNQQREQQVLALATTLSNADTANQCMSVGSGQVMGFNFARLGFANATDMVNAFNTSERSQMQGMVSFFVNDNTGSSAVPTPLANAIRARNYNEIARLYNGSNNVATYSPRIRAAAEAYQRVTTGRVFVLP